MSSAKSSRVTTGHVIETNASGIVTIVIDEDNEQMAGSDDSSDDYPVGRSSRPHIGVRTPVSTSGSPKFINSENCQNLLIKENKTNVIVVNSGRASASLRTDPIFSRTTPCCSPTPSDLQTHHNIVSKTQTHYVVINKPKPSISSTVSSSQSSSETASKSSPTKLRLWTQPTSHSTPRSPPVVVSTRTRSHTALPPDDVESDCMEDKMFFKYLNLIPTNEPKHKSKLELKMNWPLREVNKIAKPDVNVEGKLLLANFRLLREEIKSVQNMEPMLSSRKLQWYREAQNYNEKLQHFRSHLPADLTTRRRIQTDLEQLHNRLMTEKSKQNAEEEKYRRLKAHEESLRIQKQELNQELDSYANAFEISSLMGRRVRLSLHNSFLSPFQIYELNFHVETHCNQKDIISVTIPQNSKLSTRITRSTTGFAGLDRMWGPRSESHQYSFSRKQRLNRYMRLETGLNWKSRLVKKHCRRIDVEVAKINRCPCCLQLVEPEWGHSCHDSDEESIPDVSSVNDSEFGHQSDNNTTAEEISINSEIITATNESLDSGQSECNSECVRPTDPIDTYVPTAKNGSESGDTTIVLPTPYADTLYNAKPLIDDKIMIQKVPFLNYKTSDKNIIESNNIQKLGSNGLKRKICTQSDAEEEDIVIVSEVRPNTQGLNRIKLKTEPVIVTHFLTPDRELKPPIKQNFVEKRLRSQQRNNSEEIIIRKIIK